MHILLFIIIEYYTQYVIQIFVGYLNKKNMKQFVMFDVIKNITYYYK